MASLIVKCGEWEGLKGKDMGGPEGRKRKGESDGIVVSLKM